jgi:ribonuclease HI
MKKVTITCDGSSLGNGYSGARAGAVAILCHATSDGKTHTRIVGEYLGCATNNQAEIVAAAIGLEALKAPCQVEIITDSRYVVDTLNGLYRQKKNHEFWRRLKDAALPHAVTWNWTRGHAGHPIQELCDIAAKDIAAAGRVDQDKLDELARRVPKQNAAGPSRVKGVDGHS